jgi:hydroxyethylthiazole kinase-like uncharacterized protein yjeF
MYNLGKILTGEQTKLADNYSIRNEPISSIDLMERASLAFVKTIENRIEKHHKLGVVCGTGNNGGDGFAVARILIGKGYCVECFLLSVNQNLSSDCALNLDKLDKVGRIATENDIPDFTSYDIIIDAIFGSGLSRPIKGIASLVITSINIAQKKVFSIDIPSGLYCDKIPDSDCIIKSDFTVCFQRPKFSFFFSESGEFMKEWTVADIGLNDHYIQRLPSDHFVLDENISSMLKKRETYSHKGTYGHSLVIAGSYGKMGAAILASKACLRSGVGLLTTYVPSCGYQLLQISVHEAMCLTDKQEFSLSELPDLMPYNSIGIGPGIGQAKETLNLLKELLNNAKDALVLDADALNIIAQNKKLLNIIPKKSIITPHPKEFERLVGKWTNSMERLEKQKLFSKEFKCIVVLKGAHTCITSPDGIVFFNTSGNAGMATGGSGDVLTGIITGLLAQGYDSLEAALIGVYFHGKAGDEAAKVKGKNGLIASDIIEFLRIEK